MNKPQTVSVGFYASGDTIEVWCAKFSLRGKVTGTTIEERSESVKRLEKRLAELLKTFDFGELSA